MSLILKGSFCLCYPADYICLAVAILCSITSKVLDTCLICPLSVLMLSLRGLVLLLCMPKLLFSWCSTIAFHTYFLLFLLLLLRYFCGSFFPVRKTMSLTNNFEFLIIYDVVLRTIFYKGLVVKLMNNGNIYENNRTANSIFENRYIIL